MEACSLNNKLRSLWTQHVVWTRDYILASFNETPDKQTASQRLMQNQTNIGNALKPVFGNRNGDRMTELLKEHIRLADYIIGAVRTKQERKTNELIRQWRRNGEDIADFLTKLNPKNWPPHLVQPMLQTHLTLTIKEVQARANRDWKMGQEAYDQVYKQAMYMADTMTMGINKYLGNKESMKTMWSNADPTDTTPYYKYTPLQDTFPTLAAANNNSPVMQAKAFSSNYTPGYKYTTLPRNFPTLASANDNSPVMQAKAFSSNYTPGYQYTTLSRNFPTLVSASTNQPLMQGPANLKEHHDLSRYSLAKWKEVPGPYCYNPTGKKQLPNCPGKEPMLPPEYAPAAQIPQRNRQLPWTDQKHSWAPGAPPLPRSNVVFDKPKATPASYLPYFRPVGYPTPGLSKMDKVVDVEGLGPTPPNLPQRNRLLPFEDSSSRVQWKLPNGRESLGPTPLNLPQRNRLLPFEDPSSRVQWKLPNGREPLGPTPPNLPQRNRLLPFEDQSSRVQWKLPNGRESLAPEAQMKQRDRMLPFDQQVRLREGQGMEAIGPASKFHQVNRLMPWPQRQEEQGPAFRNNPGMSVPPVHNAGKYTPFPNF